MADEEAEFEILSEEGETPDEHDLEILETLEEHGADLSEPREIRIDLLFPTEEAGAGGRRGADRARLRGRRLRVGGRGGAVGDPRHPRAAVDRDNVTGFRHRFEELAARHGGEFDGWEAAAD